MNFGESLGKEVMGLIAFRESKRCVGFGYPRGWNDQCQMSLLVRWT